MPVVNCQAVGFTASKNRRRRNENRGKWAVAYGFDLFIATFGENVEKVTFKGIENTVFAVSTHLSETLNGGRFKRK